MFICEAVKLSQALNLAISHVRGGQADGGRKPSNEEMNEAVAQSIKRAVTRRTVAMPHLGGARPCLRGLQPGTPKFMD